MVVFLLILILIFFHRSSDFKQWIHLLVDFVQDLYQFNILFYIWQVFQKVLSLWYQKRNSFPSDDFVLCRLFMILEGLFARLWLPRNKFAILGLLKRSQIEENLLIESVDLDALVSP